MIQRRNPECFLLGFSLPCVPAPSLSTLLIPAESSHTPFLSRVPRTLPCPCTGVTVGSTHLLCRDS